MWRHLLDDLRRPVTLQAPPRRVVSLVPSVTELVCALGRSASLIGCTQYCTEPSEVVRDLARVGGTKSPDLDRIAELAPDLVLVNSEENRLEDFQQLIDRGLMVWVSFPRTVAEAAQSVRRLGAALDAASAAEQMADDIDAAVARPGTSARRVFCPIWRKPWMSFNRETYAHDLVQCAGGSNVCAAAEARYPIVQLAEIALLDPEVVLLPDEPYPFAEKHRAHLQILAGTAAMRDQRIHFIDGKALFWYGPRTAAGLRTIAALCA
jgi:ABC-type Fe3+-hydroxamate transport system substrate-binding protein